MNFEQYTQIVDQNVLHIIFQNIRSLDSLALCCKGLHEKIRKFRIQTSFWILKDTDWFFEKEWRQNVRKVILVDSFNQPVDELHAGLTLGNKFNQQVDQLPVGLTHLTLWGDFNQPVDQLPAGLTHLQLGWEFNQPVDKLPAGLTHLKLGGDFNQPVQQLPAGLTHLTLGYKFDHPLDNLPQNLLCLKLLKDYPLATNHIKCPIEFY